MACITVTQTKKIIFITPPYHCGVAEVIGRWMPLNLVYLAGAARQQLPGDPDDRRARLPRVPGLDGGRRGLRARRRIEGAVVGPSAVLLCTLRRSGHVCRAARGLRILSAHERI